MIVFSKRWCISHWWWDGLGDLHTFSTVIENRIPSNNIHFTELSIFSVHFVDWHLHPYKYSLIHSQSSVATRIIVCSPRWLWVCSQTGLCQLHSLSDIRDSNKYHVNQWNISRKRMESSNHIQIYFEGLNSHPILNNLNLEIVGHALWVQFM